MTDFRIRRCRIDVVRTAGAGALWSTRDQRKALARRVQRVVLAALEELLAARFRAAREPRVVASLALEVPVRLEDVLAPAPLARRRLRDAFRRSLAEAVETRVDTTADRDPAGEGDGPAADAPGDATAAQRRVAPSLIALLVRWHRDGSLAERLRFFETEALRGWTGLVEKEIRGARAEAALTRPAGQTASDAAERIRRLLDQAGPIGIDARRAADVWRARLLALALLAADGAGRGPSTRDFGLVETLLPLPRAAASDPRRLPQPDDAATADGGSSEVPRDLPSSAPLAGDAAPCRDSQPVAGSGRAPQPAAGSVVVETALPFLLLPTLHRSGWLACVAPVLEAAGCAWAVPAFGFALALKALPAPRRGWQRDAGMLAAAAAFAGRSQPVPGQEIQALARLTSGHRGALHAAAARALLEGHAPRSSLLLVRHGGSFVLFDEDGIFPVLAASDPVDLVERMDGDRRFLEISREAADGDLLRALHDRGHEFLARGELSRGELWKPVIASDGSRLLGSTSRAGARRWQGARLRRAAEVAAELLDARPVAPSGKGSDGLEACLAIAAGMALGQIAWALCQSDPDAWALPDPVLAFERFHSLSARVDFRSDRVDVALPLGARHRDLRAHELLSDVPAVPWLDGRTVRFHGG